MGRPKKTIDEQWYDIFADADAADQDAMLRVLAELHRQKRRGKLTERNAQVAEPLRGLVNSISSSGTGKAEAQS